MVAVPFVGPKVAALLAALAKFTIELSLEVQVELAVTSVPDEVAVKAWFVPLLNFPELPHGVIAIPVGTLAVVVALTPLYVAVMVTDEPVPSAVIWPIVVVLGTTAQPFELCQMVEVVTFCVLVPNVACAVSC